MLNLPVRKVQCGSPTFLLGGGIISGSGTSRPKRAASGAGKVGGKGWSVDNREGRCPLDAVTDAVFILSDPVLQV